MVISYTVLPVKILFLLWHCYNISR